MARRGIGKFSENDFAARILAGIIRQRSAADIDDLGANSRRSCLGAKAEGGDILALRISLVFHLPISKIAAHR